MARNVFSPLCTLPGLARKTDVFSPFKISCRWTCEGLLASEEPDDKAMRESNRTCVAN